VKRFKAGIAAFGVLAFSLQSGTATPALAAPQAEEAATPQVGKPALWKIADEDTTIYLFGTVHALPEGTQWSQGPIEAALAGADELVTEIPMDAAKDPAAQPMVMGKAMLKDGTTLRERLGEEDRASYEAALGTLGMPVTTFDRFEPWFAGMNMAMIPLMKAGYSMESGVELAVDELAADDAIRTGLETLDQQIDMFDTLPEQSQVSFLMASADNIDQIAPLMKRMTSAWLEGDSDRLAELMNLGLDDERLANALLYNRNAKWAAWVDDRMDRPGTVFIAVGAGHLAGTQSVQDFLSERGFAITRVQ
tara:strand:+ start:275 stop:1195 length:921 start_codon:yes stop_codon:yes gene_type:complete